MANSDNCVKVLLIGNSYTYYNGYGEILSRLGEKANKNLLVVRATRGNTSANDLIKVKLEYVAWLNGKKVQSGNAPLNEIAKIDFCKLDRPAKWDFIVLQNNATLDGTYTGDIATFKKVSPWIQTPKNFIINCTHFSTSVKEDRLLKHQKAQKECGCSLIDTRAYFKKYNSVYTDHKWIDDLTIKDKYYHQSPAGMYINALCTFAKIFGVDEFSVDGKTNGVPLYNTDSGTAKEFITNKFKAGNKRGTSIPKSFAYSLQSFVKKYSKDYIGDKLYIEKTIAVEPKVEKEVNKDMSKTYFGVDISEHNGVVDWDKVAKKVDFAILRICWVGNNENKMDITFEKNYAAAKKAGVKLGAYVYMYSKSTTAAEKGANWVLSKIKGKSFELPIYCDMEDPTISSLSKTALTNITKAFNEVIKKGGYDVGVYSSRYWFDNKLDKSVRKYHTWIAHYTSGVNKYKGEYEMWQNSSKGRVNGVNGNVDTNYLYADIFKKEPKPVTPVAPTPSNPTYKTWTGYVTANSLNVREKPNTNCKVLGIVKTGTAFTIQGESGDFYKTTYNKKTAYVAKKYISKTKPTKTPSYQTGVVTANALNVRAKATTLSKILGVLKKGSTVKIYGESGNFYKTTFNNKTGYVAKKYIKKK